MLTSAGRRHDHRDRAQAARAQGRARRQLPPGARRRALPRRARLARSRAWRCGRKVAAEARACARAASAAAARSSRRRSARRRAPRSPRPPRPGAATASAQMIAKPAATAAICGAMKPSTPAAKVESSSGHRRLTTVMPGRCSGSDRSRPRAREQPRDRRVRLRAAPEPDADQRRGHPPAGAQVDRARLDVLGERDQRDRGEQRRRARAQQDGRLEEVDEAHAPRALGDQRAEQVADAVGAVHHHVGRLLERRRASRRTRRRRAARCCSEPISTSSPRPRKASRSVVSSPT